MDTVHIHLLLNHIPVIGMFFGLLLLGTGLLKKSVELSRASLAVFLICAAASIPVYFSGEGAEEAVEHMPGVTEGVIEQHEEGGKIGLIVILVLGVLSLGGLFLYRNAAVMPRWFGAIAFLLALVVFGVMAWVSNLGGQVRHTEIRNGAPVVHVEDD